MKPSATSQILPVSSNHGLKIDQNLHGNLFLHRFVRKGVFLMESR